MNWTEEDLQAYNIRSQKWKSPSSGCIPLIVHTCSRQDADEGSEAKLQSKIERWLTERGFFFFHDRSRGKNTPGQPDLVVAMKQRTLWLELKSRKGKLRPGQCQVILKLLALGHEVYEVRSFKQFLEIAHKEVENADEKS